MAGHSKWHNIKYKKELKDAQRAKIFGKFSRMIMVAAREGGPDPEKNEKLRAAIEKAREFNMPKENIERAIKRGTGEIEGRQIESLLLEGFAPGGVGVLVEVLTDNKNRSVAEIRKLFEKEGGKLAGGSVKWMFQKKGRISVSLNENRKSRDEIFLLAVDLGAEDVKEKENEIEIFTPPEKLIEIKNSLEKKGIKISDFGLDFVPKEEIEIKEEGLRQKLKNFFSLLDERDDVQDIFSNALL